MQPVTLPVHSRHGMMSLPGALLQSSFMCGSDVIVAQLFKQPEPVNPEGRPCDSMVLEGFILRQVSHNVLVFNDINLQRKHFFVGGGGHFITALLSHRYHCTTPHPRQFLHL